MTNKFNEHILYMLLNKLYSYYDTNLDKSIFSSIPIDYISDYKLAFIHIFNTTNNKDHILKFIDYYHKISKNYSDDYKLSKISSKILKLIIINDHNILNSYNLIYEDNKSIFIYEKAKEFMNNLDNKKRIYTK